MRYLLTAVFLFGLWLLMSGVYKPLVVGLGAASSIFAAYIVMRMSKAAESDPVEIRVKPLHFIAYFIWLMGEIVKSNIAVTKLILGPSMPITPHFFKAPYSQKTDFMQATFANSITLTPGTLTVEVQEGKFCVHAIGYDANTMDDLAEMDRRVALVEKG